MRLCRQAIFVNGFRSDVDETGTSTGSIVIGRRALTTALSASLRCKCFRYPRWNALRTACPTRSLIMICLRDFTRSRISRCLRRLPSVQPYHTSLDIHLEWASSTTGDTHDSPSSRRSATPTPTPTFLKRRSGRFMLPGAQVGNRTAGIPPAEYENIDFETRVARQSDFTIPVIERA